MGDVLGYVDGFVGSYLNGWAALQPEDRSCLVEVMSETGALIASGRATRQRDDLAALNLGRCDLGFRIPLRLGEGRHLRVMVEGVELLGSPIAIGADQFDGYFEIRRGVASGWVSRRGEASGSVGITLRLADGTKAGSAIATRDEAGDDPFFRPYRFDIQLAAGCVGRPEFILSLFVEDTFICVAAGGLGVDGYIDVISPDFCNGWLLCPDAPGQNLELVAYRDGVRVGAGLCDLPRIDLRERYPLQWRCGFMIRFDKPEMEMTVLCELSLRLEGGQAEMLGGPYLVGRRVSFIAVAKQIASLVHSPEAGLSLSGRALFQDIMRNYLSARRGADDYAWLQGFAGSSSLKAAPIPGRAIAVIVPVYKGVDLTESCIRSVLETFGSNDHLFLVSDAPPEPAMSTMLERFRTTARVTLLINPANLGFIGSVNRALDICRDGDVLLLNSDTRIFPGGLDEMRRVLHGAPDIATVTAMSNNATIFTYPHPSLATAGLGDVTFDQIAAEALAMNTGMAIDVPTGHGFCLLIRREVLNRLGRLNEAFGRGYGEENELCARATDLGFRHVAAAGAFVEHRESISFGDEKAGLVSVNLPRLEAMYPEYTATIMEYERTDDLRAARWKLDAFRLATTRKAGLRFALTVENWLGGGTKKAVSDLGSLVGYGDRLTMRLECTEDGQVHLVCNAISLKAVFSQDEHDDLLDLLNAADIDLVIYHQMLGFGAGMIRALGEWSRARRAIAYAHDFYAVCPRTTLINAVGQYCAVASADVCGRCVSLGGGHEASRLVDLTPQMHRDLFAGFFAAMATVIAPSRDTAAHLHQVMPGLPIVAIGHPNKVGVYPKAMRAGSRTSIVILGAIGPHKGSSTLHEIASCALLTHPHLNFTVVGHTDIDMELKKLGNVTITGRYRQKELLSLLAKAGGAVALFLNVWPETFSYTLSEAVQAGLLPVVPDIGAPAERVRDAGFGVVYPFPIDARHLLAVLDGLVDAGPFEGCPQNFDASQSVDVLRALTA